MHRTSMAFTLWQQLYKIIVQIHSVLFSIYLANTAWSPLNEIHDTALTGDV